jgi:IS4 transposase
MLSIKAIQKQSQEPLFFITNKMDLTAVEISQIYKSRWEIETFFKFIKQELNERVKHFFRFP